MAATTLKLGLEGQVSLQDYALTLARLRRFVEALCLHVDREAIVHWEIAALAGGSATTTILGSSLDHAFLEQVTDAYLTIAEHFHQGTPAPYPALIIRPAAQLTQVLNGQVTSLRFGASGQDIVVQTPLASPEPSERTLSLGEVRGTVETLQRRKHRFTLYDELFDQAVVCRVNAEQEVQMGAFWGKEVVVTGEIVRHAQSGRAMAVREVFTIEFPPSVPPGSFEKARGIFGAAGSLPGIVLRRLRDAD